MTRPLAGRKQSPEHIKKRVEAMRASGAYARNGVATAERNRATVGSKHSDEHKAKISSAMRGKKNSLGVVRSIEFRQHLSTYWTGNPNHNHWIDGGGVERRSEREKEMGRLEYRLWREAVFIRDDFTCVHCGQHGGQLQADHIKPYSTHPELRLDVNNGRTLCKPCHLKTPTWGAKALNFAETSTAEQKE